MCDGLTSSVPSGPPQNVTAVVHSSTQITVTWQNVVGKDRNGIILGYKISYRAVGQLAVNVTEMVQEVKNGSAVQTVLISLEKYIEYKISVLAYTSKGDGPRSQEISARTDEDGMGHNLQCCFFLFLAYSVKAFYNMDFSYLLCSLLLFFNVVVVFAN